MEISTTNETINNLNKLVAVNNTSNEIKLHEKLDDNDSNNNEIPPNEIVHSNFDKINQQSQPSNVK